MITYIILDTTALYLIAHLCMYTSTMEITLSYIFNTISPVRSRLLELLKPSEIAGICMVTGSMLSKYEKNKYMYPLNEIFYSLEWSHPLRSNIHIMSLLGDNVENLCNPKYKRIQLLCLLWKDVDIPCNDLIYSNAQWKRCSNVYDWSENVHSYFYIYQDVQVNSITMHKYNSNIEDKRIILNFCMVDDDDIFKLSVNPISEILNNKINFNTLLDESNIDSTHINVPRLSFIHGRIYNDNSDIAITPVSQRRCIKCNSILYRYLSITPYDWIGKYFALSDLRWYFHIEDIESHSLHEV